MTSRRIEKRIVRKCELSVESLTTRIAPSGIGAGSLMATGLSSSNAGSANYRIKGDAPPPVSNPGLPHRALPF
jgi:hypothetical protein